MIRITFIDAERRSIASTVAEGTSLMQAALAGNVAGIEGECGGSMSCGTCVITVPSDWMAKLPPPSEHEAQMLTFSGKAGPNVRLSCQIKATPDLDGMVVEIPGQ